MKTRPYGLFVKRIYRRFLDESFDQISASLAYTTLLAIVPLVAVVFWRFIAALAFLRHS